MGSKKGIALNKKCSSVHITLPRDNMKSIPASEGGTPRSEVRERIVIRPTLANHVALDWVRSKDPQALAGPKDPEFELKSISR